MQNKIILVDGNSIINRAFYGIPILSNKNGEYTNAVYGFLNMVLKIYDEQQPSHMAVAFDMPIPTFRHKLFPDYKANRRKMPIELRPQFSTLRILLDKMNIKYLEKEGYEADDILGTLAKKFENYGFEVIIFSGDKDLLQMASDNIKVFIPKTQKKHTYIEKFDSNEVLNQIGVTPKEFIDVKAIMGDKSDNISGVPGIGEKNAIKLISEYKSIENALEILDGKKKLTRFEQNLCDYSKQALFCKRLVAINTNINIKINQDEFKTDNIFNNESFCELERLQIKSFASRFNNISWFKSGL